VNENNIQQITMHNDIEVLDLYLFPFACLIY